jgi:hypothetical protein
MSDANDRLIQRQLFGLDPCDNVTVIYGGSGTQWFVMRGAVRVAQFNNQADALGYARRLFDGGEHGDV